MAATNTDIRETTLCGSFTRFSLLTVRTLTRSSLPDATIIWPWSRARPARDHELADEIADVNDLPDEHDYIPKDQMTMFEGRIDGWVERE